MRNQVEVDRLLFADEQSAFDYALYGAEYDASSDDVLIEARGRQVVVARGGGLGDPEMAQRVLDAAWNGSLPTPRGEQSVSAILPRHGGVLIVTGRPDPILDRTYQGVLDAVRARKERPGSGVERLGPREHYAFRLESGTSGTVRVGEEGLAVLVAKSDRQRRNLDRHLARVLKSSAPQPRETRDPVGDPSQGARGALERLLD